MTLLALSKKIEFIYKLICKYKCYFFNCVSSGTVSTLPFPFCEESFSFSGTKEVNLDLKTNFGLKDVINKDALFLPVVKLGNVC